MSNRPYDIAVVGAGVVGLATAVALTRRGVRSLVVLEAEADVAQHQTGHNSGVIHSGLYYRPGSLKAKTCVAGREALYRFCAQENIPHQRCGKLVVAVSEDELPGLATLAQRGQANGLRGIKWLAREALGEMEANISGIAGLWVEETGIVDFVAVCRAYARVAQVNGAELRMGSRLQAVRYEADRLVLQTATGVVHCKQMVSCAGLHADRVARLSGVVPGLQIVPFRGEYYELTRQRQDFVRHLVYPVPDPRFPFLGVHFTRKLSGGMEVGPNAVLAFCRQGYRRGSFSLPDTAEMMRTLSFWRMVAKYGRVGIGEVVRSYSKRAFVHQLQRLAPGLTANDLVPGGCGVRAQALSPKQLLLDDFSIAQAPRMLHLLNAPSPAATASLAIGESIAAMALTQMA